MPFNSNLTLDPFPSITEQPKASKRLSIAFQAIEPETGSVKIVLNVRVCLAFTQALYAINATRTLAQDRELEGVAKSTQSPNDYPSDFRALEPEEFGNLLRLRFELKPSQEAD
jgi:hypothetical protein